MNRGQINSGTDEINRGQERVKKLIPNITTVNYGCPGETTASFIQGPCPWTARGHDLHNVFADSQLDGAVAFLRAHPGEESDYVDITIK